MISFLESVGRTAHAFFKNSKEVLALFAQTLYWVFVGPFKKKPLSRKNIFAQTVFAGLDSLVIVFFVDFFIGMVLAMGFILFVPYRRGEAWALWAIGTVAAIASLLVFYGLLTVELKTSVPQPWYNPLISIVLVTIGLLITPSRTRT